MQGPRNCPNCGSERASTALVCATCGHTFEDAAAAPPPNALIAAPPSVPVAPPAAPLSVPQSPPSAPDMVDFRHPRERRDYRVRVIVAGLVVAIAALGWVGYSTLQDLAGARDDLSAAIASLVTTQAALTSETAAHADANSTVADLTGQVNQLESTLSLQTECTTQLADEIAELDRISELQRQNDNRFAEKSKWAAANLARDKALNNALNDYLKAYQAAFQGQKASANSWIETGNKQVSVANSKLSLIQSEIKAGNSATKTIGDALTALTSLVAATKTACGAAG